MIVAHCGNCGSRTHLLASTCGDCQREYRARERENAAAMRLARQSHMARETPASHLTHDVASRSQAARLWLGILVGGLSMAVLLLALYILLTFATVKRSVIVVYAIAAPVTALITLLLCAQDAGSGDRRGPGPTA